VTYSLPIETDRLTLRRYLETDYDDLLKLQSSVDVTRFLLYDPKTPEQVKESLAGRLADVPLDTDGQALTVAVILR
jgi:RimJ/RimL family protein N-acetyltransferase